MVHLNSHSLNDLFHMSEEEIRFWKSIDEASSMNTNRETGIIHVTEEDLLTAFRAMTRK